MPTCPDGGADLDTLADADLDALSFGVIQLDGRGIVTRYNAAESRFSGRRPEEVLGRHFFREVAPCTNLPAFHGRFLQGVRSGALDESFVYTFSFTPRPVRVAVTMWKARSPDRFWITVRPLEYLEKRTRAAVPAIEQNASAEQETLSACARETIHMPGAIQPHMALLVADPVTWCVRACSANAGEAFGCGADDLIGRVLGDLFPATFTSEITQVRARADLAPGPARQVQLPIQLGGIDYLASVHEHAGNILVELERVPQDRDFAVPSRAAVRNAVSRLRSVTDAKELAQAVVEEGRALTGFERVLVYRFDRDWNGDAIAESKVEDWEQSLLGLRFPASDIPAQARALYVIAPPRFVVDRDYAPVPLLPGDRLEGVPIDLSFATSRSLSPSHLEYQRNLGVNGSMSASIIVDGRLWGLVIGHHRQPHYVAPETRAAVSTLVEAFSLRLEGVQADDLSRRYRQHVAAQAALLDRMAGAEDLAGALLHGPVTLLNLFDATGAAIVDDREVCLLGAAPDQGQVLDLVDWLLGQEPAQTSFATEHLSHLYPQAAAYRSMASGLLAAFSPDRRRALLWFRHEVVRTVAWGGDPRRPVGEAPDGGTAVLPRRSFERWLEEKAGSSTPWETWHLDIAKALADALDGVVWRQNRQIATLNAKQEELIAVLLDKEKLLAQKDVLVREVDHRVKNSLQIVASFLQMQARAAGDPSSAAALQEAYARVMSVARVHGSLYQAENVEEVDIGQTIRRLCEDLAPIAGDGRDLVVRAGEGLMMPYRKAVGISIIAAELITNAIKYAYPPGQTGSVEVRISPDADGCVCMVISDQGRGFPADLVAGVGPGGLGMRVVKAMLDQINGRMRIENVNGARFTICA